MALPSIDDRFFLFNVLKNLWKRMMQKKVVFVQFGIARMSAPHRSFSADIGGSKVIQKGFIKVKLDFGWSSILTIYNTVVDLCLMLVLERITAIDWNMLIPEIQALHPWYICNQDTKAVWLTRTCSPLRWRGCTFCYYQGGSKLENDGGDMGYQMIFTVFSASLAMASQR